MLREIPMLGSRLSKKLLLEFKTPENIFNAVKTDLTAVEKLSRTAIKAILNPEKYKGPAARELELVLKKKIKIATFNDELYPPLLRQIPDPPLFLTYAGHIDSASPCLAVVGSRSATQYGLNTSEHLAYTLAQKGFQIVSGLARGIDAMAHRGALRAGRKTIAVLGSGLNKIYPRENKQLYDEIAEKGTLFSEFKLDTDPLAHNFPVRNRIIAGCSCGTIVVEAAQRSGSLITARLSAEYNREVFAVPGSIKSNKSKGTHFLLKQGAKLVENEMDIIEELYQFVHHAQKDSNQPGTIHHEQQKDTKVGKNPAAASDKTSRIINMLNPYPVHIDEIIEKTGINPSDAASVLLDMELEGRVIRHPGDYYSVLEDTH